MSQGRSPGHDPAGHALPGQRRRHSVGERAGAAAERDRRPARRLRARGAPPRGRRLARPPRPAAAEARAAVRGVREARAEDGHLPLLLRADADPEVAAVPATARAAQEERLPLPRLRHPRQVSAGARVRQARRRRDRRLLRRDPLGARGARDPAGARPDAVHARAAVGQPPPARRARAVEPREEGDALGDRGVRAARRRARHRRGRAARRRTRALRARRHHRRPAERRLARHLRARVDGTRQARRHVPEAGRRRAQRRGLRHSPPRRSRDEGDARRRAAPARRAAGAPPRARGSEPRLRRAGARHRSRDRPPGRSLPFVA